MLTRKAVLELVPGRHHKYISENVRPGSIWQVIDMAVMSYRRQNSISTRLFDPKLVNDVVLDQLPGDRPVWDR